MKMLKIFASLSIRDIVSINEINSYPITTRAERGKA
jgi:hypothetical protein